MRDSILNSFNERSKQITLPGFIESEYEKFSLNNGLFYLSSFAGFGRILRKTDRLLHGALTGLIYSLRKFNLIQNFVECEAHRELFLRYLRIRRKAK
jgi:poly-gamma-glutamate synthesis protein (capsule biosynthesis protein)